MLNSDPTIEVIKATEIYTPRPSVCPRCPRSYICSWVRLFINDIYNKNRLEKQIDGYNLRRSDLDPDLRNHIEKNMENRIFQVLS